MTAVIRSSPKYILCRTSVCINGGVPPVGPLFPIIVLYATSTLFVEYSILLLLLYSSSVSPAPAPADRKEASHKYMYSSP